MENSPQTTAGKSLKAGARSKKKLRSVQIRMYRVGFGDCFLLTFNPTSANPHHMLIDFGVYQATRGAEGHLKQIANDIRSYTKGKIHTVVATHEHADHQSGFKLAAEELNQLQIDELWLPWTSDRGDPDAQRRADKARKICLAANAAVLRMAPEQAKAIQNVLDFGPSSPENCSSSPLWDQLHNFKLTHFLEPDDVIDLPAFGVRIYVLAPAREIFQPRQSQAGAVVPGQGHALNQANSFLAAVVNFAGLELSEGQAGDLSASDLAELFRLSLPFDRSRGIPIDELVKSGQGSAFRAAEAPTNERQSNVDAQTPEENHELAFLGQHYGFSDASDQGPDWRRIDTDWLNLAGALALSIDHSVNNTSLVLAIELVESGKVLLFPGDAQIESWRTWQNASADVADLLNRTVVYKVGHHGSHNATLTEAGLGINLMNHPDLMAFLPLDESMARDTIGWDMPDAEVKRLVDEKSHGRVLRVDVSREHPEIPPRTAGMSEENWKASFLRSPEGWEEQKWKSSFLKSVKIDAASGQYLWLEYTLKP